LFGTTEVSGEEETKDGNIEAEIEKELKDIRNPKSKPLFTSIKLDTQCGEWGSGITLANNSSGGLSAFCSGLLQDATTY
jgi:hypothetical protein